MIKKSLQTNVNIQKKKINVNEKNKTKKQQ